MEKKRFAVQIRICIAFIVYFLTRKIGFSEETYDFTFRVNDIVSNQLRHTYDRNGHQMIMLGFSNRKKKVEKKEKA